MMAEENVRTWNAANAMEKEGTGENKVARRGDWVEIWRVVLPAGNRAPQVPPDTAQVPLEMRLRGFLLDEEAQLGQDVVIQTRINREVEGRLVALAPSYGHNFGVPQPELLALGQELRQFLGRGQKP